MTTDVIEQKVVEIIDKLQALAQPAMQVAIDSTRVSGILYLAAGVACAVICGFSAKYMMVNIGKANSADYDKGWP